jgi:hypothetical protein
MRIVRPEGRVGRELEALSPVELLGGADQPQDALLDQVEQGEAEVLVALGVGDDEPQVGVDEPLLGLQVAALDALCQVDLLFLGQEGMAPHLAQQQLHRVGRGLRELVVAVGGRRGVPPAVVAQLDPTLPQAVMKLVDVLAVEVLPVGDGLDLRELQAAAVSQGCELVESLVADRHECWCTRSDRLKRR